MDAKLEYRKLGGGGTSTDSINLPPKFVDKLGWQPGDYIIIFLDEQHHALHLYKAKNP
jgi:hypothetical protein